MATAAEFAANYNRDSSILYNSQPSEYCHTVPPHHSRCIFEKSLMCENSVRACVQAGYYPCCERRVVFRRQRRGVNFNNCASALSFKLRRHVIPAPSRKQPQHFTHKKSMVEPPSSFLHTHA
ncbi:hypothetical protein ACI65C_007823 [Semiaphis heraclei]